MNTDSDETFDRVKEKNSELLRRTEAVSLWASHGRTVALSVPLRTSSECGGMREGGREGTKYDLQTPWLSPRFSLEAGFWVELGGDLCGLKMQL